MSNITARFYSNCLRRGTMFQMYLPYDQRADFNQIEQTVDERPVKTLFLLHGYTGDAGIYVPEFLAEKYHFAIVAPNGENGFWLDGISTGHEYCKFLGEELPGFIRRAFHLALSAEDTYIMGMSMGGFGAIHTALKYPETFGKAVGMSSALIVHEVANMKEGEGNPVANYEYYRECFGEPSKVLESENNPETLVKNLKAQGRKLPEIFMSCGTEDFLIEPNRAFHRFLEEQQVAHVFEESAGMHDMEFWNRSIERFIPMMFGGE